jgi:hypothetical protein
MDLLMQCLCKCVNYAVVEESSVFHAVCAAPAIVGTQRWGKHVSCCQATAINTWMMQEWGGVTWLHQQWHNNRSTVGRSVSRVADQGFIGEMEVQFASSSQWEIAVSFVADSRGSFVVIEDLKMWIEDFMWAVFSWVIVFTSDPDEWIKVKWVSNRISEEWIIVAK